MAIVSSRRSSKKTKQHEFLCDRDRYPNYRDFGQSTNDSVGKIYSRASEDIPVPEDASGRNRGGKKSTFPAMLYQMVDDAEDQDYTDVIAWMPHGRSFIIKDKHRFTSEILPRHFGSQNSFASFQRQLNVYGFLRMTKNGPDRKSYYHELFLRGRKDLIPLIPRKRKTTARVRRSLDPTTEPNLYAFPPCIPGGFKAISTPDEEVSSSPTPNITPSYTAVAPAPRFTFNPSPDVAVSFHHHTPELASSSEESSNASTTEDTTRYHHDTTTTFDAELWQAQMMAKHRVTPEGFCEEEYHIVANPADDGDITNFLDDVDMDLDRF